MRNFLTSTLPLVSCALLAACGGRYQGLSESELNQTALQIAAEDQTLQGADGGQRVVDGPVNVKRGFEAALRDAIIQSDRYSAAIFEYEQTSAQVREAASGLAPQITASGTAGGVAETVNDEVVTATGASLDISLRQLLYDGGRTTSAVDAAAARAFANKTAITVAGNEVALSAAQAWIDVWQHRQHLGFLRARVREVEPLLGRIRQLISSGMVDRASLTNAERQLLDVELEEERLEAELAEAESRFRRFFRTSPNGVDLPSAVFAPAELREAAQAWRDAPELIGAAAELIALRAEVERARAEFKPNVGLRTSASSPLSEVDEPSLTAGIFFEYEFGDGGRRNARLEAAERALSSAEAAFEATKSDIETSAEAGLEQYVSITDLLAVLERQIAVLDEERQTLTSQLTSGQSSIQQVVEVEILAYRARARRISLLAQRRSLELALASRQGALLERLGVGAQ